MKSNRRFKFWRPFLALVLLLGIGAALGWKYIEERGLEPDKVFRFLPIPESEGREEAEALARLEQQWNDRLTYPTGRFNPAWLRQAAAQDRRIARGIPAGDHRPTKQQSNTLQTQAGISLQSLSSSGFISLGPKPERMTGCSGCFDYTTTAGRINAIVVDPTTTTNGSIVAYAASVGGGVWKTTNCCSSSTTWTVTTDDPTISVTSIDTLAIDPNNHNTIYAGTGDLNFGSFSMGSQGILKSTDAGASWTVLGATVFGPAYNQPSGQFPQYDAVGKVRVDPNNSNNVVAGTKKGLFLSYDGGVNWTGPCLTNNFVTQRQDITGLELSNIGGSTRILAAVGPRGFATTVQYDLGNNGANGIYKATLPASGCPTFTSIASNSNGFVFGTAVSGSPYTTGANLNAGSGNAWVSTTSGNQLGRIDIGVAPSNPDVIYAQVQSIAPNNNSGCTNTNGCQLGAWVTTNGGTTWSFMGGSAGGSLQACASSGGGSGSNGSGDYPQNWYDQGVAVDPNNPDKVWFDTFDVWYATRTGTHWYDVTCGYTGVSPKPVHVDQHALAFVPGSSSILLLGNDGGAHGTTNASSVADNTTRPTWFNMDSGFNTIEFYNGDISANFANAANPMAGGGAQDNMNSFVTFSGSPTGPVQWQGNVGGDGFFVRIDGKGGYFYASNNNGAIHRCTANCSNSGSVFGGDIRNTTMRNDTQSFVEPFDLFRGNPSGTGNAECGTRCNHIIVGTNRVWENIAADTGATWTARTAVLTKNTLGNRSFINNLHYSPANQTLAIVATNDGNVQILYGLGGTTTAVNVTGNNTVLPNRPILDVAFDSRSDNTAANPMIGYAAVGGFNANTPSTPGHVFRVVCNTNCASFTWTDKTGNLPDIPVDSIIVNPNFPQQVFAGTDFGLYFTDDITQNVPVWYRFQSGLPNAMIWSMSIDRGNTTLSVWTRSRGAYVWALPSQPLHKTDQTITFDPLADKTFGDPDFGVTASASSGLTVTFSASGNCTVSGSTVHITGAGSCTITASQAGNATYNAAPNVQQSFNIAKADQTINFPAIADKAYGTPDFDPGATASSGLAVSYSASGSCSIVSNKVHITGVGSCQVTASQAGNPNYNAAQDVSQTFNILKGDQTISFPAIPDKTFADAPFAVNATASSGLTVSYAASGNCTVSGNTVSLTSIGSCTITASQPGDDNWNAAQDVSNSFNITAAQTSLNLSVSPSSVQYSDQVMLQATVSPASANGDTATGSVEFFINGVSVGSGAIDGSGLVNMAATISLAPGNYAVSANFTSTNPNFSSSSGSSTLTVTREDARAYYNGNSLFWTGSVNDSNANVTLSAAILDITAVTGDPAYDAYEGDIRNATVTFVNRDTNTALAGCSNLPIGLVSAGDTKTGTATCSTTLSLGNNNSSGGTQYTIGMIVNGYYTRNSSADDSIITIAQPIPSNFITGGGYLVLSNSSGLVPGDVDSHANFGFNVKFNKKGTSLQGNINILVRSGGHVYKIKGNAISSLGVVNNQANFTGKASIQDVTDPLNPISLDGNATLQLWMTDNGDPGSADTIGIQVLNKNGGTWFTSSWNGTKTIEQLLGGGNVSVK